VTIGALIRDLRLALGWSQGRLASRLCELGGATMTRDLVSRWERGVRTPGPYWLRHLATALDVPLAILEEASVRRREFLTDIAGSVIAPLAAADLIRHGFASALAGGPTADDWRERVTRYGHDYMTAGSAIIQRRLATDLVVIQQQLDTPAAWGAAARLMTLYGKTFPGNDGARAITWYRMATEAADRSGDRRSQVWVRGRAAIALGYEGAALPVASMFADQALALDDRPSLGRVNALLGRAHAAAIQGDHATAYDLLTDGRRTFDRAGSDDAEESDYAVPWWRLNVFISLLAARLGDERTAVEAQDQAARYLPDSMPRFRTHLEMHRALMLARAGDRAGGIAYGRAALAALPAEKHSLTLRLLQQEIEQPAPIGS
jgi:transcriptional regulator with XRE-family HTH domain